jgi:hypothetical protein
LQELQPGQGKVLVVTDPIRARLVEFEEAEGATWDVDKLTDALRAVLDLCDQWVASPDSSIGLQMNQMTNGCAAYWIRERIAKALVVSDD